ncbi:MAG: YabP/YqfC family sporulation protein [Muribaculaceae bacterium]|nr:YabP/YqfC family sporulation protein [Muribaculaceae bacterium]
MEAGQIVDMFGLPRDLFMGLPLLSLAGNRSLCITNHRGIRQYSSELIVVSAKSFAIQITGRNLYIPKFSGEQLEITGYMEGIMFVP